ncbi:VOC family protein [Tenacibaculum xiamenense]|uniref:VOC family protein n=1 Tax=Tenacibaculum xiamenense TaxID=1261553 RepID=UPI0038950545
MKIKRLQIYCSNLNNQITFYTQKIGLTLVEKSNHKAIIQIGNSELTLVKSDKFKPYHFAFNIPSNKEIEALEWLKTRVKILKDGNAEIQDFQSWNAKAIYFYDQDHNIVELIARKNLNNQSTDSFSGDSIFEISEIGLPVNNIESIYKDIHKTTGMAIYSGGLERFCAIGDENGLFICINKQIKDWYPTGDKAYSSSFEIEFIEQDNFFKMVFNNGKIETLFK